MSKQVYRDLLARADSDDIKRGLAWYPDNHKKVLALAAETGYSPQQVAGVIACLSPMVEWNLNLRMAERFLKAKGKVRRGIAGFERNRQKARDVLAGDLEVIRGPKVRAFYETLLDPEHAVPVIDTQMIAAFFEGTAYRDDLKIVSQAKKRLAPIHAAVKELAEERKWSISAMQAVLWVTFKRVNGPYADQLKLWK